MSYESDRISKSLSPLEVAIRYGVHVDRRGYSVCPFHAEDTPSMLFKKEKGGHYHCFGCGAHGDSISLVMRLLNIPFKDALVELDNAFRLGVLNEHRERLISNSFEKTNAINTLKKKKQKAVYDKLLDKHREYHQALKQHPASWEDMSPEFIEALQNMDQVAYKIDCIEEKKYGK